MSVTARKTLAGPLAALKAMLSECTSFQKLVQAANASAALARIYSVGEEDEPARPFAIVDLLEDSPVDAAGGTRNFTIPHGRLSLTVEIPLLKTGTVTSGSSSTVFSDSALAGFADDHFNGLTLQIGGVERQIADFAGATGTITLSAALSGTPANGTEFTIYPASVEDAFTWFRNIIGDIKEDLLTLSGAGGYLSLSKFAKTAEGRSQDDKEDTDYIGIVFEMEYGL